MTSGQQPVGRRRRKSDQSRQEAVGAIPGLEVSSADVDLADESADWQDPQLFDILQDRSAIFAPLLQRLHEEARSLAKSEGRRRLHPVIIELDTINTDPSVSGEI